MNVQQVMTRDVKVGRPDQSIEEIARVMAGEDLGSMLIAEDGRLLGVITDRDIVVRGVALGLAPSTQAIEVMSVKVLYCSEDQSVGEVASRMAESRVRRMPVVDLDKRLVGIVALADLLLDTVFRQSQAACLQCFLQQGFGIFPLLAHIHPMQSVGKQAFHHLFGRLKISIKADGGKQGFHRIQGQSDIRGVLAGYELKLQAGRERQSHQCLLPFVGQRAVVAITPAQHHPAKLRHHAQGELQDFRAGVVAISQNGHALFVLHHEMRHRFCFPYLKYRLVANHK